MWISREQVNLALGTDLIAEVKKLIEPLGMDEDTFYSLCALYTHTRNRDQSLLDFCLRYQNTALLKSIYLGLGYR